MTKQSAPTPPNPFTPTFGATPPRLVGRDQEIDAVRRAIGAGPGDPARAVLLTGPRGSGKTVLLNTLEQVAAQARWTTISESTQPGLVEIMERTSIPAALAQVDRSATKSRVSGVSASLLGSGASLTRQVAERHPVEPRLRQRLEQLARVLAPRGQGVFITLDEVHRSALGELKPLFHALQHCVRQGLPVAFAAAGLPSAVADLLNQDVLTYLRRAERFTLGRVPDHLVAQAIEDPFRLAGRSVSSDALALAVSAVEGYPFLIQVVGFELWQAAALSAEADLAQARLAVARAARTASRLVLEPVLKDLSARDREFVRAMAAIGTGSVMMAEIMSRLGATRDHVNKYRARLIAAEVIEPAGRGLVRFAIPFLGERLRSGELSLDWPPPWN